MKLESSTNQGDQEVDYASLYDRLSEVVQQAAYRNVRIINGAPTARDGRVGDSLIAIVGNERRFYQKTEYGWMFSVLNSSQKDRELEKARTGHRHILRWFKPTGQTASATVPILGYQSTTTDIFHSVPWSYQAISLWVTRMRAAGLGTASIEKAFATDAHHKFHDETVKKLLEIQMVSTWNAGTSTWTFYPAEFTDLTVAIGAMASNYAFVINYEIEEIPSYGRGL